mgnify:FL=1
MKENVFFKKKIFTIEKLFLKNVFKKKKKVKYIRTLDKADKDDLTFYDSRIYIDHAAST